MSTLNVDRQPSRATPALVALGVVLVGGIGYRWQDDRFGRALASTPLSEGTLDQLPPDLNGWVGRRANIDESLLRATGTDQQLFREYRSSFGYPSATMFIGYGIKLRDLTPHRPEVCYSGMGWTLLSRETVKLPLAEGGSLPCELFRFRQGDLSPRVAVVVHYYIVDGRCGPDVNWLRETALRRGAAVHYAARVQIDCPVESGPGAVERSVEGAESLAAATATAIVKLMPAGAAAPPATPSSTPPAPAPKDASP